MQHWPLTLNRIVEQGERWHGNQQIISRLPDGSVYRSTYRDLAGAARRVSTALVAAGIGRGDRVATLSMNGFEHLAIWYGVMGIGAVCHTLNPRLHEEQLRYIVDHAGDRLIFVDAQYLSLLRSVLAGSNVVERVVVLHPETPAADAIAYAEFLATGHAPPPWGGFDEESPAGLCYTSGTTGAPKGVTYTHRSNTLMAMNAIAPDVHALSALDVVLAAVPMFHANAWGLPFSTLMVGARIVFPGNRLDGGSLHELIEGEGVTFSAAVPTVWQGYVDHLRANAISRTSLQRVVIGGSACPESLMQALRDLGIDVLHAWGMTETSPVGLIARSTAETVGLPEEEQRVLSLKQGRKAGVDVAILDEEGRELDRDGRRSGRLMVRGPAVIERYAGHEKTALTADGWFDTGDLATIDAYGFVRITDRAKDVIKSGGEWISSLEIEDAAMLHPDIAQAAVVGIEHPRWGERPKLIVQLTAGKAVTAQQVTAFLEGRIPKWWLPDVVEFVAAMPIGPTGKIDKKQLRATGDVGAPGIREAIA